MNDPLEQQLRALRPARLPEELRTRLASPPEAAPKVIRFPSWKVAAGLAAAACVAILLFMPEQKRSSPAMVLRDDVSGAILAERTVAVVDDGGQRAWEIVETERLEGQTLIADAGGYVALTQRIRHERAPREIYFD